MIRHRSTASRALRLMPLLGSLTLLAPLLLSACGGSSTTAEKPFQASGTLTIKAYDYYFAPKSIEVPANQPITITFTNKGKVTHITEIKGLISETTLQPGESKTFTITPLERAYTLYDEVFVVQGMQGVFKARATLSLVAPTRPPPRCFSKARRSTEPTWLSRRRVSSMARRSLPTL